MTLTEQIIIIGLCSVATMLTRFLPFLVFSGKRELPRFVQYMGKALPPAVFGMLAVYCLKGVSVLRFSYGIPELIAIAVVILIHLWKRQMLLSIAAGTAVYMALIQTVF